MSGEVLDLVRLGLLPPLPHAFLEARDLDLLAPLELVAPGTLPRPLAIEVDRRELAVALGEANASYGHPGSTDLAARLADPATAVVVTGQQPGLLGGPLYTLSKAVAAARWAEELSSAGRPAVSVFWMATEDHDFRESSWASFQLTDGPRRFDLGEDLQPLMPVGMRSVGAGIEEILDELRTTIPSERFSDWCDTLARWYTPTARFGEAFARLLVHLLGERCPLVLDAMLPAVKQAQRPWLRRTVERRDEVETALAAASDKVSDRGYPLQVTPQPGSSPLFFLQGGERRRIAWAGDGEWTLRGGDGGSRPVDELLAAIVDNPAVVMPGVLVRPVVQDAILGTTLQVMGPGEVSYLPQLTPLYDVLGVPAPSTALRPQSLALPANQMKKLTASGVTLEQLIDPSFDVDRLLAGEASASRLAAVEAAAADLLAALEVAAEPVGAEMKGAVEKTSAQIRRGLEQFEGRLTGAIGRSEGVRRGRIEALQQWVRPGGELQERVLSTADLPGRYGDRVTAAWFEQLGLDGGKLTVVEI